MEWFIWNIAVCKPSYSMPDRTFVYRHTDESSSSDEDLTAKQTPVPVYTDPRPCRRGRVLSENAPPLFRTARKYIKLKKFKPFFIIYLF